LQTGSSSEEVYLYNENEEKVSSTGIKFFDYLVDLSKKYELKSNIRKKVPQGELIIISKVVLLRK